MKHPHKELINAWLDDLCIVIEEDCSMYECSRYGWVSTGVGEVLKDMSGNKIFRIKPREFVKGEWYPCIDECGCREVYYYTEFGFVSKETGNVGDAPDQFKWIGKSLGKIKFGEE